MANTNDFETVDQGIEKLKEHVSLRDKMGGAMYWNIVNDECVQLANKISSMDPSRKSELLDIVGRNNIR